MALQNINLGTYANDGTGDDLRTAFEKVQANFVEIYNSLNGARVGAEPPTTDVDEGELWWSTLDGRLYIKYSTAWIDASPKDPVVYYDISTDVATGGANLSLNGSDGSLDSIKISSGLNITVTRTNANTITLSSTSYIGNVTGNVTGTVTGSLIGNVTGNVTGELFGNSTGGHTGNVTGNLTGNVDGNVNGNARTVTNGVYTTQTYNNPAWITGLAGSKISGNISGNAGTVTNGVYTTSSINALGDVDTNTIVPNPGQALIWGGSNWRPNGSTTIVGNISGNAGTVTNGVYTTSSINSLVDVDTVSVAPTSGQALVWNSGTSKWAPGSVSGGSGGVSKIIAGTNITISPTNGLGEVTINSTGGGSGNLDFGTFTAPAGFSFDLGSF
jgi:hypothetical protein